MSLPPQLPRSRPEALPLIALLSLLTAALASLPLFIGSTAGRDPGIDFAASGTGLVAVLGALGCSIALLWQRRGLALPALVVVASVALAIFLAPRIWRSATGVIAQLRAVPGAQGAAIARRPIPQAKDASTAVRVRPALIAWGEAMMVQPYEEHGHHDPAWDEAARQLIRFSALELLDPAGHPGDEGLRALGRQIQRAGCDDPWVLLLIHRLRQADPDQLSTARRDTAELGRAHYAGFPLLLASAGQLQAELKEEPPQAPKTAILGLTSLRETLAAPPSPGEFAAWTELFVAQPILSLLEQDGAGFCQAVNEVPRFPDWFRKQLKGRSEILAAWQSRGSGYANEVTPAQWQGFHEHLTTARAELEAAWKLSPEPATAKAMIKVALGSSALSEMRVWFDRAVQARFDYIPAYDSFRVGLLPRWHGSEEAILAFGRACLATQRFETDVPWQMLRAVADIADERDDADEYYRHDAPWDDLRAMLEGYVQHGDPARRGYYLSVLAVMAQKRAMDSEVAATLQRLNYQLDPQVALDWNLPEEWVGRMVALSGPTADIALAAQRLEDEQPLQAIETMRRAQKLPNVLPIASAFLEHRIHQVQAVTALQAVPWQPLRVLEDPSQWKLGGGNWRVASPGIVEVSGGVPSARVTWLHPVGENWELRGEFEFSRRRGAADATIFCGPLGGSESHGFTVRFWVKPDGSPGVALAREAREDSISKETGLQPRTPFYLRLTDHRLRVRSSGGQWFSDQPLPEGVSIDAKALLGLGSISGGETTVRFRQLEWRGARPEP